MNPQMPSNNRTTPMTMTESAQMVAFKKSPTTKTIADGNLTSPRRELMLSSSLKPKKSNSSSELPVFISRVKNKDNYNLKIQLAKSDGKIDPYQNPQVAVFRDDVAPYNKPIFLVIL